ncbi:MAG: phosphoribosylformylglycinamidine cyclo-ligase [Verrucomicrobia bacterium]|nr:phosphoribosylformylglycinamidine cyclo-ligase [Verrucomicrobiota bacterium]
MNSKTNKTKKKSAYAEAGVDIDEMMSSLSAIKKMVGATQTRGVQSELGSFGGLFTSPGKDHVLVTSTDGVGTKLKVAAMADRHNTIGQDLVNHCVNDILVQGARPLFFLDYLGTAQLKARVFKDVISGLCKACRENGCALLGGETAEMPGLYPAGEYDLVGTILGSVPRRDLITGKSIRSGDVLIGLPSSGLQTNGYSLARKAIFEQAGLRLEDILPGTKRRVVDLLLAVHKSYLRPVLALQKSVKISGMAHITGGGFYDNIPRILPSGLGVEIDTDQWRVPPLFTFIQDAGKVDPHEMYRVFNMGIGFIIVVRRKDRDDALAALKAARAQPRLIGRVVRGKGAVLLTGKSV